MLDEAAEGGADLAILPELFPYLGPVARLPEIAEPVPGGASVEMLGKAAARGQLWIAGGSVPEQDGDHLFNTAPLRSIGRARRPIPEDPSLRRGPGRSAPVQGVHHVSGGDRARDPRDGGREGRPLDPLRPPLPRAVPRAHDARCGALRAAGAVPAANRRGALGGVAARAGDREPVLPWRPPRSGASSVRRRSHDGPTAGRWSSAHGATCWSRHRRRGPVSGSPIWTWQTSAACVGCSPRSSTGGRQQLLMRRELWAATTSTTIAPASMWTWCIGFWRRTPTGVPGRDRATIERLVRESARGDRRVSRSGAGRVRPRGVGRLEHGVARGRLRPRGPSRARARHGARSRGGGASGAPRPRLVPQHPRCAQPLREVRVRAAQRTNDGAPPQG